MRLTFSPWVSLVGGIFVMLVSGTMYMFASWAPAALQVGAGLSQQWTNFAGAAANMGAWASVFTGFFFDRFGPRLSGLLAGSLLFLGYFLAYLAIRRHTEGESSDGASGALFGLYSFLWGCGSGLAYTVALATNLANFKPADRGRVVGVLVCFFGLSGGVFVQLLRGFFGGGGDVEGSVEFLLFLGVVCATVPMVCGGVGFINFVRFPPPENLKLDMGRSKWAFGLGILLTLYVGAAALIETFVNDPPTYVLTVVLCAAIGLFLFVPCGTGPLAWTTRNSTLADPSEKVDEINNAMPFSTAASTSAKELSSGGHKPLNVSSDRTLLQAIRTLDFWLLFGSFLCVIGPGITVVNNLSAMTLALESGLDDKERIAKNEVPTLAESQTLITLFSVFNTFGRIAVGVSSDYTAAIAARGLPATSLWQRAALQLTREAWLIVCCSVMCATQAYLAMAQNPAWLWVAVVFLGLSYGGVFCTLPVLTSNFFGVAHFGANFGLIGLAPAIGGELLSTLVAGGLAEQYAADKSVTVFNPNASSEESTACIGWKCYGFAYIINAAVCLVAIILAVVLAYRRNRKGQAQYTVVNDGTDSD